MAVAFISHPDCLLHDMGQHHPEQPARLRVIDEELALRGLNARLEKHLAPLAAREQLLRVHTAEYIESIYQLAPQTGLVSLDPDTAMNPYTLTAALRAAGAVIYAVDLVMQGAVKAAFCSIRPPGHHAERDRAMGFCFFNNVAVGVAHALEHYQLKRVAIVDFDVHHGNGTENIFQHDERVLLCSSFQHPFYPFSGATTKSSHIINLPLPAGSGGEVFRKKAAELWFEPIKQFQPDMLFFSAGFDAYINDEMANLRFTEDDYAWITQEIKQIAEITCQGRMISALEGGYDLAGLGKCVAAHIGELLSTGDSN
ncbi:MAG: histone deacetylase family protein [Gammaproteobacteria bacterium]